MKQVYIKHNGYFIQETVNGFVRVLNINNATDWFTTESAIKFLDEININPHHCSLVVRETIESEKVLIVDEWLSIKETELCSHCNKRLPMNQLRKGRVERDSDLEFYCEECYEEVDSKLGFVIPNQLDEMFDNPIAQVNEFIKVVK